MAARIDPITVEVIRNGFVAATDEMKINLMRTAHSPLIYEVLDFSVGLFDASGDMIAQAAGLPVFLGNLSIAVKQIMADVGTAEMRPGDIYLINDTYTVGNHLNDMVVCGPVFAEDGHTLTGFAASRAHWLDIGAVSPGWTTDTTEIYQEGIRLRSVQLYRAGVLNRDVYQILQDNIRFADSIMGDLRAQIAASHTGERRFREIVGRYGLDTVQAAIAEMFRMEEAAARAAIAAMPDGVYTAEAFMDDDGVGTDRPQIKVMVRIAGDELTVDLTGSSPQTTGPINCGVAATLSAVRLAFKAVANPLSPVNEGTFVPLQLVVPDNCMFNAKHPAPSALYGIILITLCDAIFQALAPAIPDRIPAAHYADVSAVFIYGVNPSGGVGYLHAEIAGGGWGATSFRDGESVMITLVDGDTRNVPIEIVETRFPLIRVERYEVRPDSGGPGRFRGGLGQIRDFRVLDGAARYTTSQERSKCPPWGLFGGGEAATNRVIINPGTPGEIVVQKATGRPLKFGDVVSVQTGGGGGYGHPLEREPEAVRMDAVRGYVTPGAAARQYGVVLDPETLAIDWPATRDRRKEIRN